VAAASPGRAPRKPRPACAPQVGNGQLSQAEQRSHFALWCLIKSPLLIGTNLSAISASAAELLRSPELLAVHQDPLGAAGDLVWKEGNLEAWAAPLQVGGAAWAAAGRAAAGGGGAPQGGCRAQRQRQQQQQQQQGA
jgi:hypothetical protein